MAWDLGDVVPLTVTVRDTTGAPVNATTVVLTVTLPDGTTANPAVTNPSTGVYACDYPTTVNGRHTVRWTSTGPAAAYTDAFDVRAADTPYLVSLADAKEQLNITATTSDEELRVYLEAATGVVERHLGQAVVRRSRTEEHTVPTGDVLVLNWAPVVSITSLARVDGTYTWSVPTLHVTPTGVVTSPLGLPPSGALTVTYVAGMPVVPEEYALAARIIVQHLWETQRGAAGAPRAGGLGDTLTLSRSGSSGFGFAIPNRALELLGHGIPGVA